MLLTIYVKRCIYFGTKSIINNIIFYIMQTFLIVVAAVWVVFSVLFIGVAACAPSKKELRDMEL